MTLGSTGPRRPSVVVLTRRWGGGSESQWALRMLVGALATAADVTVCLTRGEEPRTWSDGVFRVVETATASEASMAADRLADGLLWLSRDGGAKEPVQALAGTTASFEELVGADFAGPWERAGPVLAELRPDLVVVADVTQYGAVRAAGAWWPGVPLVVVPLIEASVAPAGAWAATLRSASLALVFSEEERQAVAALCPLRVTVLGLPMQVNESVLRSAHELVGQRGYIALMTDAPISSSCPQSSQARFVVARFPRSTFVLCGSDRLVVYEQGRSWSAEPAGRGTDLLRLMAWAALTVDLHPGTLFSRRCLESLVYGTPIVVPSSSRAREHAAVGRCGLWFSGLVELAATVEAASAPRIRERLAEQSAHYVALRCLSRQAFVAAVLEAVTTAVPNVLSPLSVEPVDAPGRPATGRA